MANRQGDVDLRFAQVSAPIRTLAWLHLVILHTYPPLKLEQTECSETSAYKIQTPGNYPEESVQLKPYISEAVSASVFRQKHPIFGTP